MPHIQYINPLGFYAAICSGAAIYGPTEIRCLVQVEVKDRQNSLYAGKRTVVCCCVGV